MTMPRPVYGGADGLLRRSGRPIHRSGNLTAIPHETALSFAWALARSGSIMARPSPSRQIRVDRKSVVEGKRVSVRVDLGGRRIIKKKKNKQNTPSPQ